MAKKKETKEEPIEKQFWKGAGTSGIQQKGIFKHTK